MEKVDKEVKGQTRERKKERGSSVERVLLVPFIKMTELI